MIGPQYVAGYSLLRLKMSFRPREAATWFVISERRYRVLRWLNHCSYSTACAAVAVYATLLSGAKGAISADTQPLYRALGFVPSVPVGEHHAS